MKYPHPIYEHRVISGLTIDQLARLEACLVSDAVMFTTRYGCSLYMPPHAHFEPKSPRALAEVPCLMLFWEEENEETKIPLAKFAKNVKRDAETGLYTVDIIIVVAIAYAADLHEPHKGMEPKQELGMYRVDRKVRDAIDIALGLYSDKPDGEFVKMGAQHVIKSATVDVPTQTSPVSKKTLLADVVAEAEKACIICALERLNGRRAEVATSLGISPKELWEKMKSYGLGTDPLMG